MNKGNTYESALELTKQNGQEHVLKFWQDLNTNKKQRLLSQIDSIDFSLLEEFKDLIEPKPVTTAENIALEPAQTVSLEERKEQDPHAIQVGAHAIGNGEVAAFLVAGGQGSRLGLDGPKGMFPVTPVKKKSLFQVFAEKIQAINKTYQTNIPWYIMTSLANNQATIEFFKQHNYFNLDSQNVMFFNQEMIPAIDREGKLLLDAPDHIFMNPNGHGGSIKALWDSGAIKDMQQRNIKYISYFQVDNILVNVCDPAFIGYHIITSSEMSNKVVRKAYPEEKVGIICKINGQDGVIEYSDLSDYHMNARDEKGRLKFWSGSIAIHILNVEFVEKENKSGFKLPYHIARKSIPYLDETGKLVKTDDKNGIKFETFVFDALRDSKKSISVEVDRKREFSPLKNKSGSDSAETVRNDLLNLYADWFTAAGFKIPSTPDGIPEYNLEVSPLFATSKEVFLENKDLIKEPKDNLYLE